MLLEQKGQESDQDNGNSNRGGASHSVQDGGETGMNGGCLIKTADCAAVCSAHKVIVSATASLARVVQVSNQRPTETDSLIDHLNSLNTSSLIEKIFE
jgi:hypothetical protein